MDSDKDCFTPTLELAYFLLHLTYLSV